jgi:hypothetical protein
MLNLKTLKNICWKNEIIGVKLSPKNDIYRSNVNTRWFFLNKNFIQENWENIYIETQEYWNNERNNENLKYFHNFMIDIDIWEKYKCKTNSQLYDKLLLLEIEYWLNPHYIIKTKHWYHIHFLFKKLNFKKYWKKIEVVYEFIRDFLYGDIEYKWKVWLAKIPWTLDFSIDDIDYNEKLKKWLIDFDIPFIIHIEKFNDIKKYNILKLYEIYWKLTNKDSKEEIKKDDSKEEKQKKINKEFIKSINKQSPKQMLELLNIPTIKDWRVFWDNSLKLWYNKETKKYYLNDFSWKIFWNYNFLLRYFKDKYWEKTYYSELLRFITINYWIKRIYNPNYIVTTKFIFNHILNWDFHIDYEQMKKDYWENYEKLLKNKTILNKKWKLSNMIVFIILNILSYDEKWMLKNANINDIFWDSYYKDMNRQQKGMFVEYLEIMKYLYIETQKYWFIKKWDTLYDDLKKWENIDENSKNKDIKITINNKKVYLLNKVKKVKANYYDITILGGVKELNNEESKHPYYIPLEYLKKDKQYINLLLLFLKIYNEWKVKWEIFNLKDIYDLLESTYTWKNIDKSRNDLKNKHISNIWDVLNNISCLKLAKDTIKILKSCKKSFQCNI